MAIYNELGQEVPDPVPVAVPAGWTRPEPLADLIRRMVRTEFSRAAAEEGEESFEEADDFDVEDEDPDPLSAYEINEAAPEALEGVRDDDAAPPPDPQKKIAPEASTAAGEASPAT